MKKKIDHEPQDLLPQNAWAAVAKTKKEIYVISPLDGRSIKISLRCAKQMILAVSDLHLITVQEMCSIVILRRHASTK